MRRLFSIALACLVTSACAIDNVPEESTFEHPGEAANFVQEHGETPLVKPREIHWRAAHDGWVAERGPEPVKRRLAGFEPAAENTCGGPPDPCCSRLRATETRLFGKAAWYNLVGSRTASGEILDTITATAAHRSLPLASYAKVTNLDNGRSIVVKINDRGPYSRGRILDLSPRAADALDMKRSGVVAVVIEPLVDQTAPTVAVLQNSAPAVTQ